ncbi:MAG TPA: FAD-binding oxidoreductase, partial [Candidatus Eisenbacteria bacterium]|nr:FAD-binding oxidoreductase [Candidatus Eisenbacteria bacterium]
MTSAAPATGRRRKFWGWGYEGEGLSGQELELLAGLVAARFGLAAIRPQDPPQISEIELRRPRVDPPPAIAAFCSTERWD